MAKRVRSVFLFSLSGAHGCEVYRESGAASREAVVRDEYIALLKKFDVDVDPRYLFTFIDDAK